VFWFKNCKKKSSQTIVYPDTCVGTDSHTTMINGLGVLGWGVGGIEAESVMLGESISMLLPEVIGVKLVGKLKPGVTATDLVLTITQILRKKGVVDKFVEFFGEGVSNLTLANRATIANMAPEYGATCGIFAIDEKTIEYLNLFRIKIAYLKTEPDYERLTSMLARLLVGLLDDKIVKYNDTIFLSDVDLLPISKNYYHNFNRDETSVKCFEAISLSTFKYTPENKDYKMFTIPHIGLTKKKWLEMMKLNDESKFDGKTALSLVIKYYGFSFLKKNKELLRGGDSWFLDQKILAISLAKYMKSNKHVFMYINKGFGIKQHRDTTSDSEILNIINTYNYVIG
jgi:hypothetical protein